MTGSQVRLRSGASASPLALLPEANEIARVVRPLLPVQGDAFEGTLQAYCILLARIQRGHEALERVEQQRQELERRVADGEFEAAAEMLPSVDWLEQSMQRWISLSLKHANALGLTPQSAARILRDVNGGDRNPFRPPSEDELRRIPPEKLKALRDAFVDALRPEPVIDVEAEEV